MYVFFANKERDDPEREIVRGYSDENGVVQTRISPKHEGKEATIRIRHAGFEFQDFTLTIPKHGIIHTAKMEPDLVYNGPRRGATIDDPVQYFRESTDTADRIRSDAIRLVRGMGIRLGRIPILFWAFAYMVIIFAFAGDYQLYACSFKPCIESFVHALYLSIVTITTLGYGDVVPTDDIFRLLSALQAVSGIVILGLFLNSLFYERR